MMMVTEHVEALTSEIMAGKSIGASKGATGFEFFQLIMVCMKKKLLHENVPYTSSPRSLTILESGGGSYVWLDEERAT